jgi:hypothetical protein
LNRNTGSKRNLKGLKNPELFNQLRRIIVDELNVLLATLTTDKGAYDVNNSAEQAEVAVQADVLAKLATLHGATVSSAATVNADIDAVEKTLESFRPVLSA